MRVSEPLALCSFQNDATDIVILIPTKNMI